MRLRLRHFPPLILSKLRLRRAHHIFFINSAQNSQSYIVPLSPLFLHKYTRFIRDSICRLFGMIRPSRLTCEFRTAYTSSSY